MEEPGMTNFKRFLAVSCCAVILTACTDKRSPEERAADDKRDAEQNSQHVHPVATAPDGTKLWVWYPSEGSTSGQVYFSSSGASWEERHGKHTDTVQVPNAD
jgi:hypothetical protein